MREREPAFDRLCRSRELLHADCAGALPLARLAAEARMSPWHFVRRFEALFGSTPHQYRIRTRIERARELLAQGTHSVTEVCFEVGFSSLGSFSDLFTRRVGSTPSAYRRAARVQVSMPGTLPLRMFPGCLSLMALLPADAWRNFREAPRAPGG